MVLEVCDEGRGLPEEFRGEAFERFTRAEEGRSSGGTGLGLAIVRAIARAHGGEATIAASGDAATIVRVELPLDGVAA
jgi:signal transduction histidine kinase